MSADEGRLLRGLAADGAVRVLAVDVRGPAEEARRRHGLGAGGARLAAEGAIATALMSAYLKGDERVALQLQASHPRFAFHGEVDAEGSLRARLTPPDVQVPPDGRVDGIVLVLKSDGSRELYRGHTEIRGETFERALAGHLASSAQVDVVVRVAARVGAAAVEEAIGLLVERMPPDPGWPHLEPDAFRARFGRLADAPADETFLEVMGGELAGEPARVLEERPITWRCRCSLEKVEVMLGSLGARAVREMLEEDGGATVTCEFCRTAYELDADRLRRLVPASADQDPSR